MVQAAVISPKPVPVEPTPEMINEGRWPEYGEETSRMHDVEDEVVRTVWVSMLAAAPSAPGAEQAKPVQAMTDEQIKEMALQEQFLLVCDDLDCLTEIVRTVEANRAAAWGVKLEGGV